MYSEDFVGSWFGGRDSTIVTSKSNVQAQYLSSNVVLLMKSVEWRALG
jgi:hypothetical protein